ncbi:hypothetical protein J6590_022397 [Homalodisca vitripennis]|nr:hypothetical protein J6590_022397 [Homalodisca vitripennis]
MCCTRHKLKSSPDEKREISYLSVLHRMTCATEVLLEALSDALSCTAHRGCSSSDGHLTCSHHNRSGSECSPNSFFKESLSNTQKPHFRYGYETKLYAYFQTLGNGNTYQFF